MWKGYELSLYDYLQAVCYEWHDVRGYKDSVLKKAKDELLPWCYLNCKDEQPKWLGNEDFHKSHISNLVRKKPEYYRPIFGNDILNNLKYVWPQN